MSRYVTKAGRDATAQHDALKAEVRRLANATPGEDAPSAWEAIDRAHGAASERLREWYRDFYRQGGTRHDEDGRRFVHAGPYDPAKPLGDVRLKPLGANP